MQPDPTSRSTVAVSTAYQLLVAAGQSHTRTHLLLPLDVYNELQQTCYKVRQHHVTTYVTYLVSRIARPLT